MVNDAITESEIWADLDRVFSLPEREPGDIDVEMMIARYGGSNNANWRKMDRIAAQGEYEVITVRDDSSPIGKRKVLRKVR